MHFCRFWLFHVYSFQALAYLATPNVLYLTIFLFVGGLGLSLVDISSNAILVERRFELSFYRSIVVQNWKAKKWIDNCILSLSAGVFWYYTPCSKEFESAGTEGHLQSSSLTILNVGVLLGSILSMFVYDPFWYGGMDGIFLFLFFLKSLKPPNTSPVQVFQCFVAKSFRLNFAISAAVPLLFVFPFVPQLIEPEQENPSVQTFLSINIIMWKENMNF